MKANDDPLDREIRALLRQAHDADARVPPFARMWSAAHESRPRPAGWWPVAAGALVAGALAALLALIWHLGPFRTPAIGPPTREPVRAVLALLDPTPLDFLLRTPGYDFIETSPRLLLEPSLLDPSILSPE